MQVCDAIYFGMISLRDAVNGQRVPPPLGDLLGTKNRFQTVYASGNRAVIGGKPGVTGGKRGEGGGKGGEGGGKGGGKGRGKGGEREGTG